MVEILERGKYKEVVKRKPEIFQINKFLIKRRLLNDGIQSKITQLKFRREKMEFSKRTENYWGVAETDCPIGSE